MRDVCAAVYVYGVVAFASGYAGAVLDLCAAVDMYFVVSFGGVYLGFVKDYAVVYVYDVVACICVYVRTLFKLGSAV